MSHPARLARTLIPLALLGLLLIACDKNEEQPGAAGGDQATDTDRPTRTPLGGDTIYVGPDDQFHTISEAVEAANEGATVLVHPGTYEEQVEITKPLTLEAFGDGAAIIDGGCERENAIRIPTGSNIRLGGLTVQNTKGAAIKLGDGPDDMPRPSHVVIEGMHVSDYNCLDEETQALAGIAVWYPDCCIEIRDNVIRYRSEGAIRGRGNGIWFKSNSERPTNGGHTIVDNSITGGWDGIGGENEGDPYGGLSSDSTVANNHVRDCWDDGIQVEGGNKDIAIRDNYITRCGAGIAFAPTLIGPLYVERNVVRDMRVGLYENQFCFKVGNEGTGTTYLTENVCETEGDGIAQTNSGIAPIISRGNCFRVTRYVWEISDGAVMDFDGDVLWSSDPSRFIEWAGEKYESIRDFQRATGMEGDGRESAECPLPVTAPPPDPS
jgi:hypothetical protein